MLIWCNKNGALPLALPLQNHQFSSVTQSCPTLCDPMDWNMPGFPVITNYQSLLKLMSVKLVMPSNHLILSSSSHPTINLSQHQGPFQWVGSLPQVGQVLEFQLQQQSFQWIFRTDLLENGLVGSPCSPRDSQKSSPTPQFKSINSSGLSFLYSSTLTSIHDDSENHSLD